MSFKDLTVRAEAAMTPKPAEPVKTPAKEKAPEATGKETPTESRAS